MKRICVFVLLITPALAVAQSKSPVADVLRQMLVGREKNTVAAFEQCIVHSTAQGG